MTSVRTCWHPLTTVWPSLYWIGAVTRNQCIRRHLPLYRSQLCKRNMTGWYSVQIESRSSPGIDRSRLRNEISRELTSPICTLFSNTVLLVTESAPVSEEDDQITYLSDVHNLYSSQLTSLCMTTLYKYVHITNLSLLNDNSILTKVTGI